MNYDLLTLKNPFDFYLRLAKEIDCRYYPKEDIELKFEQLNGNSSVSIRNPKMWIEFIIRFTISGNIGVMTFDVTKVEHCLSETDIMEFFRLTTDIIKAVARQTYDDWSWVQKEKGEIVHKQLSWKIEI